MGKSHIQKVSVYISESANLHTLADKVSEFHVEIIRRRLAEFSLKPQQTITIIDKIIENLKLRQVGDFIK